MPQMSPLPWLTLFLIFIFLFTVSSSMNYFFFMPKISFNHLSLKKKNLIWKW